MSGGITPIDNAFELIGLHQCSLLMRYIFVETMAGKAIFALGFVLCLIRSLKKTNIQIIVQYCLIFFSCLLIVVIPKETIRIMPSMMEGYGYSAVRTEDILMKAGSIQPVGSPVLDILARISSVFVNSTILVIDNIKLHGSSFCREPFGTIKIWLLIRERISRGISSSLLKEKLLAFYQDHYFQALRISKDRKATGDGIHWPGEVDFVALYSTEGKDEWRVIQEKLYGLINSDGIMDTVSRDYYNSASLMEVCVRDLIRADFRKNPLSYSMLSFDGQASAAHVLSNDSGRDWHLFSDGIIRACLSWYPFVQGVCLISIWTIFPFVLIGFFLSGDGSWWTGFFKGLFIVKLLPLFLIVADRLSGMSFDIAHILGGGKIYFWEIPVTGVAGLVAMAVSVWVLFFIAVYVKRKGSI